MSSSSSSSCKQPWLWPLDTPIHLLPDSPGLFGTERTHDIHTGIDLYCEMGTNVLACQDGVVTAIVWFTGSQFLTPDGVPSSWWNDTQAILVESNDGVIVYGEVDPTQVFVQVGQHVHRGDLLGKIGIPVLKSNKGRPMVMLHLEYMVKGSREALWWQINQPQPVALMDPYQFLLQAAGESVVHFNMSNYRGEFVDPNAPKKESKWWTLWSSLP